MCWRFIWMIKLENSVLEGKRATFGDVRNLFLSHGCSFCSNFEYDQGKFDALLWRENGESIYLRIPFDVIEGELDRSDAYIQFGTPYLIKHVVNLGLDYDENSLLSASGFNQFQKPIDKDGHIRDKSKWEQMGEEAIEQVLGSVQDLLTS